MLGRPFAAAALLLALTAFLLHAPAARALGRPDSLVATPADTVAATLPAGDYVAGARDYLAEARAAFTPENRAYQRQRVALAIVSPLAAIAVGLLLLVTGVAQRLRDIANARASGRWPRALVFFTLYSLVMTIVLLPLDWYAGYALEHRFALSTQTLGAWALDQAKAFAFQIVAIGVLPLLALAWWIVESHPRRWWLWLSIGTLPVATAAVLLQPLVFDPLFNKFTTLHDAALRTDILALAERADIPARDVYEVDMSTKTKKVNAYVSGFGASQRIVLWDTTLQKMKRDEILFVMGHEMGHYVLHHIWKGLGWVAVGSFACALAHGVVHARAARALRRPLGRAHGRRPRRDAARVRDARVGELPGRADRKRHLARHRARGRRVRARDHARQRRRRALVPQARGGQPQQPRTGRVGGGAALRPPATRRAHPVRARLQAMGEGREKPRLPREVRAGPACCRRSSSPVHPVV
jgi:Zn-dependent protease with chaperone function